MSDRELLELISAQVGALTENFGALKQEVGSIKRDIKTLKEDIGSTKAGQETLCIQQEKLELIFENTIKPKLEALFEGYIQHTLQLNRIEHEVTRHEEIILRKVR